MISKLTDPSLFCGLRHAIVELVSIVVGTGVSPKRHSPATSIKFEPVTTTRVWPADEPDVGEMLRIDVGVVYMKSIPSAGRLQSCPFELTNNLTPLRHNDSIMHVGDTQRIVVEFKNVTTGSTDVPNLQTAVSGRSTNERPTTVTLVPPRSGPRDGEIRSIVSRFLKITMNPVERKFLPPSREI
jgi:hypothetical protein